MKKVLAFLLPLAIIMSFSAAVYADGGYDTPVIPIHTHRYTSKITQQPTCTQEGIRTYTCVGCSASYTQPIASLGHLFVYKNGEQSADGVSLFCTYCQETVVVPASTLMDYWETGNFINSSPKRTKTDNSGYLDLNGSKLINAKDYALILKLVQNEKRLQEESNN